MTAATPTVALVLPAYNEALRVAGTLEAIAAYGARCPSLVAVVLADDGSTDGTADVVSHFAETLGLPVDILTFPHRGKALTVRDAMIRTAAQTSAEYLAMLDSDNEIAVDQLDFVPWSNDGRTIYIGRRVGFANGASGVRPSLFRRLMSGGMRLASRVLLGLSYPDTQCGFKLFPRSLVPDLFGQQRSAGWVFDAELLLVARRSGLPIVEVPVTWRPRGISKVAASAAFGSAFDLLRIARRRTAGVYYRAGVHESRARAGAREGARGVE